MKKRVSYIICILMILSFAFASFNTFIVKAETNDAGTDLEKYITKVENIDEKTKKELFTDYLYYYFSINKEMLVYKTDNDRIHYNNFDEFYQNHLNDSFMTSDIYGPFNGAYVIFIADASLGMAAVNGGTVAGSYYFPTSSSNNHYVVWKDRTIKRLDKAYNKGIIKDDDPVWK